MTQFVAVIDIGKTNAKVAIVDGSKWVEVAIRTIPNTVIAGPPYPHFDVDRIWNFIVASIAELNADYPIAAISISAHGACGALLKSDGELAMPVLDYEYEGPQSLADVYDTVRPDFSETGSPRLKNGLNLGAQLYWQFANFPEAAEQVSQILTYPQYWAQRLTGIASNEVTSLGCHTDLWNPWKAEFSSLVIRQGWKKLMAPVHKAGDSLGRVTTAFANQTGVSVLTPVLCGIHDSNASLYPHLKKRSAPFSVVSSGTWTIAMAIGGAVVEPDETRDILVNVNAYGEAVTSARFMGGREFDKLMEGYEAAYSASDLAWVVDHNSGILPSAANRFGPFQGHQLAWYGSLVRSGGERYVAVSFYLALTTATCLELIGALGPTIVEGPFAANKLYLEMLATATNRPVIVSQNSATGTSVGAAMLTKGLDLVDKDAMQSTDERIAPNKGDDFANYAEHWMDMVAQRKRA